MKAKHNGHCACKSSIYFVVTGGTSPTVLHLWNCKIGCTKLILKYNGCFTFKSVINSGGMHSDETLTLASAILSFDVVFLGSPVINKVNKQVQKF